MLESKNKPTEAQLGTLFSWLRWEMPTVLAGEAVKWLENNATRRQVSAEMDRIRELREKRLLDEEKCFESEIWSGFNE